MENEDTFEPENGPCAGDCKWVHDGRLICQPGENTCLGANLLTAEESDFHSAELVEATSAINRILANIPERPNFELSVLQFKQGLMLAWVEHGATEIEGGVTAESDPDVIAKCLNLI